MASYLESAERYAELERERIRNIINANNNAIGNAPAITQAQTASYTPSSSKPKNGGGNILKAVGYLGEKAAAGLVQSIENIWDFSVASVADMVGADRWAEKQVANEWFGDWYDTAGDWFNAGNGWKTAGDVAGGIGTSLPSLAGAMAGGLPGLIASTVIATASASGGNLREAYDKSGELGFKEWMYAGTTGAIEGALEGATNMLGIGIGGVVAKLGKSGGSAVAKSAAKNVAKQGIIKTAAINAGKSFAGEAFEEGVTAFINPQIAKLTYDPNAENATMQEIAYSAFVGGMAGVVMGGASTATSEIRNRATANNLINNKRDGEVFTLAEALISKDDSDPIGTSIMRDVRGAYNELTESLKETNGQYTSGRQKYLLGRLNSLTVEATLNEATVASAVHAIQNAEAIAESLNALGYTDANGNKITYTAEQIREGFKTEGIGKRRAVQNALESNPILRMLSVADAANHLLMDTSAFNDQTLSGRRIQSQTELNQYIERATDAQKREIASALGIADLNTVNYSEVNAKLDSYLGNEAVRKTVERSISLKKEFEAKRDARPLVVGRASAYAAKKDGIRRYKANGNDYAIRKEGDTYTLYDYTDKIASKDLTLAELRRSLSEYDTKHGNSQEATEATEGVSEAASDTKEAQKGVKSSEEAAKEKTAPEKEAAKPKREKTPVEKSYEIAKSKVAKYDKLSANDQSMIRKIIRQGIALGVNEDVVIAVANIAARTHTDAVFNKDMCAVPTEDGKYIKGYANGAYIASEKRFYFNPEAQTTDGIIIHELDHAIRKVVDGGKVTTKLLKKAIDAAGQDTYTAVAKRYGTNTDIPNGKFVPNSSMTMEEKIAKTEDEVEAFYAETVLKDKGILKHLLAEKPTLKDRILNFFKGAVTDYASVPALEADAKKYYKQYQKWFAEFEKDQRGRQINTRFGGDGGDARYSFSSISQSFFGDPNITAKDFESRDYKETEGYKAFVDKSLDNMLKTHVGFNDVKARAEIEKSIDGIVRVAVAAKKAGYDILDSDATRDLRDSKNRLLFSSLEPNSDYFTSHDLSTICDKRLTFTEIYDEIVSKEEAMGVKRGKRFFDNINNFFVLHDIMADKGMTTPCRQCYVDSMRKNLAPMANKFCQLVQETDPNNKKNNQLFDSKGKAKSGNTELRKKVLEQLKKEGLEPSYFNVKMLTTADGLTELRAEHPLLYETFNSFYGQSKPKMPKEAVPYRFGELTAMLKDHNGKIKTETVKKINSTGGFRLQSYSDFQIKNYVDVLQVIFEAGTLGLSGHAYTKVPAFLDATDGTNLKRNISIFTYKDGAEWKIDRADSFPAPLEAIYDIVKADETGNTSIIVVSQNDLNSAWIMANDNVGYGIPFHKSGNKMSTVRDTIVREDGREIKGYSDIIDHTRFQSETWKNTTADHKANTAVKKPINIYSFWDFDGKRLSKKGLIRKNLVNYIDHCEAAGYNPKFMRYLQGGKVLKDTLKYAKELGFVPQTATVDDISFKYKGYIIPYGYYKFLGDFGMFTPDGKASPPKPLSLAEYDFDKAVRFFDDKDTLRRNEILQQFVNGTERDTLRNSDLTTEQLADILRARREEVVSDVMKRHYGKSGDVSYSLPNNDSEYMDAVRSDNKAKAREILDDYARFAGYTERLMHGTKKFGFTVADTSYSDDRLSFFATNDTETARSYSSVAGTRMINDAADYDAIEENYQAQEEVANEKARDLAELLSMKAGVRGLVEIDYFENEFGKIVEKLEKGYFDEDHAYTEMEETFTDVAVRVYQALEDGDVDFAEWQESDIGEKLYTEFEDTANAYFVLSRISAGAEGIGNYDLYAKTENFLVIEGNGAQWDNIKADNLPDITSEEGKKYGYRGHLDTWTTRSISKYAFEHGYRGVAFMNIFDDGGQSFKKLTHASDVYSFFFPEQDVKSADLVTYDDNGNVIPLSKRFDPRNPDIRFSLPSDFDPNTPLLDENGQPIAFENVVENGRTKTMDSIVPEIKPEYKANFKDKVFSATTATQIAFTNAQAGIEKIGKLYGVKDIEALVQAARAANNQAEEMIAGNQYSIGAKELKRQGDGLEKIFRPINDQGAEAKIEFFDYLLHKHNTSRMSLEERFAKDRDAIKNSIKEKNAQLRKASKTISDLNAEIKSLASGEKLADGKRNLAQELDSAKATAKKLRKEIKDLRVELSRVSSIKNKPLFGVDENGTEAVVTAEQSKAIVEMYERNHPEFKEPAKKLWKFLQNLNHYRVDTGLMSADMYDLLLEWYPYYVPAFRDHSNKGIGAIMGKYNIAVKSTVKKASGGTAPILPIDVMIARQVMETIRAGRINQLAKALYDGAIKSGDTTYIEVVSREKVTADDLADLDHSTLRPKNNEVTFFDNGERITIRVAKEIFAGFDAFSPSMEVTNPLVNGAKAVNNTFKRLVTSLNPGFLVRNGVRDIQDAGINTKYFKTFGKNWARAIAEIKNDGELWQKYRAMGGLSSSIFDFEKGYSGSQNRFGLTKAEGKLLKKTFQGIENANSFIEQLPRLAEFISSIEAGNTAEQAILDSADVTTNFARMGTVTKKLNSTLIPFLNPSIQGFSKMIRNVTSVRSARQFVSLLIKAALIGVAPMVINSLMYQDDEDYEDLRTNDKENNFLFKVGDTFIKLPRGRVASVIGGAVNRTTMTIKGEDADWGGYLKNVTQQVTPVDSMSRTIFSPFSDVKNNVTWYGSAIEGRQFENTAPKDRYDESTSSIAIAIGRVINYSPKKIHYLLDQYSGVIGDFVLPATTKKAEKDFIRGNFTIDPATSNKLSTEFYELYDNAQYAKTAGDDTAKYQVRYMNKVKDAVSKMHAEKSAIQNDPNLSSAEKLKQTRVVQILINEAYKTAIQDYDLYKKAIEATASIEDEDMRMAEATRLMYGAERALSEYNKAVYEKLSLMNKVGIDYELLYNYYFTTKDIDSDIDAKGEVVSGSKRKKVVAAINAMPITVDQKILLMYAKGYTPKDGDIRGVSASSAKTRLLNTIVGAKDLTKDQKESLAKACGLTVKNGKIIIDKK